MHGQWGEWSKCTDTCGPNGTRSRACEGILNGGKNCDGKLQDLDPCNTDVECRKYNALLSRKVLFSNYI